MHTLAYPGSQQQPSQRAMLSAGEPVPLHINKARDEACATYLGRVGKLQLVIDPLQPQH